MLSPQLKARSVERAQVVEAGRRVVPLDEPTLPPAQDILHGRTWFVLHIAPSREWVAKRELERAGFDVYLPVSARWIVTRRVKRAIEASLLTRYFFVGLRPGEDTDETWSAILNTEGVTAVLGRLQTGRGRAVSTDSLANLIERQLAGMFDATLGPVFVTGDEVVVENDTLAGRRGVVQDLVPARTSADRTVRLLMEMFGGEGFVHIPLASLRRV